MIAPEQPSEPFAAQDRSVPWNRLLWFGDESVADALVRPLLVIVVDEFVDYVADMAFAKKNHLVQAFTLYGPDERFSVGIEIGALLGHFETSYAYATKRTLELPREERITVMYEHSFTLEESIIRVGQVAGLLKHP
jgi:hypothetical protein